MEKEKTKNYYESPSLEILELNVEQGFAASLQELTDDGTAW